MPASLLDRMLEPLVEDLDVARSKKLVNLRADSEIQQRFDQFGEKSNEGRLTNGERAEYDRLLVALHLVTILQLKARKLLLQSET